MVPGHFTILLVPISKYLFCVLDTSYQVQARNGGHNFRQTVRHLHQMASHEINNYHDHYGKNTTLIKI